MKIIIIEDEAAAARQLERLIKDIVPHAQLVGQPDSVQSAVAWFVANPTPDLIFMDIELGDGRSFKIFDEVKISAPVIFTTAYDEYALRAFKVNSIDYILKPVDKEELRGAIEKFKSLSSRREAPDMLMSHVQDALRMMSKKYKERFVIKVGEHLRAIETSEIRYFLSEDKITFAYSADGKKHIMDDTLDQLVQILDPTRFFRINRKYIVSVNSIQDMVHYTNSRLKLTLKQSEDKDIIVARERVQEFKEWLDR